MSFLPSISGKLAPTPSTLIGLISGALADLYEFQVTDDDTVLITVYEPISFDLTAVGKRL